MNRLIAFFDFDGTITEKDTLLEFIRFSRGRTRFWLGFALTSPWILAYKLKLIANQRAKEKVLGFFFRHCPLSHFQEQCDLFSSTVLPGLIRPKALPEIKKLQAAGAEIVVVSASPGNWIKGWTDGIQATLIATRLETKTPHPSPAAEKDAHQQNSPEKDTREYDAGEKLTGKIAGINCYGQEKVRRIQEEYDLSDYTRIYTYGDTRGDRPMLKLGTASFFKPFR